MQKKRCSRCEEWKPLDQFYGRIRKQAMCIPCYRATYTPDYRRLLKENRIGYIPHIPSTETRIHSNERIAA